MAMVVQLLQNSKKVKNFFFFKQENICVFYKKYILCIKNVFYTKQKFYAEKKLLLRKSFFQKKTFYTENICVTNENHYIIIVQKNIFDHKNIFAKNSWQTL